MFSVPQVNRGGGLVLFWKDSLNLHVETCLKNHIDCIVGEGTAGAWRFTSFYGEPITHKCHELWELLWQLHSQFNLPWLYAGNFNEILRGQRSKEVQTEVMLKCNCLDIPWMNVVS